ncbi:MAG: SpoIIE family protein phosphatase [Crocinitomicaceae bacterium]
MFIFYLSLILVTVFFLIFGYYNQLSLQEEKQHEKLKGIVSSLAITIDADDHEKMMKDHFEKDAISDNESNLTYHNINEILVKAVAANELESPIYTLIYEKEEDVFKFGVTSDPTPYFRHNYTNYPEDLILKMDEGGVIPLYESENGMWLSAFHPIKNSEGKTVALIEADVEFSSFISMVRKQYLKQSAIALGVILLLAFILIPYTAKVLRTEERQKQQLKIQSEIIQEKNQDITDSINYALKIQNTILPSISDFTETFKDCFVLYKPKDIVAGDFYFMEKKGEDVFIACADCTGHGVPGALVSVICSNALSFAIGVKGLSNTGEILDAVRDLVVEKFKSSPDGIKDGMDVSLCKINLRKRELQFSGANNSLYFIRNKELEIYKADKQPVGQFDHSKPFTSYDIPFQENDIFYLHTDGFADQFGGAKGKKFKYKQFKDILLGLTSEPMEKQLSILDQSFEEWKGEFEQVDDVCVIGVRM